ncbi:uncharacterized protein PFLUO_LOCUS7637 [Penicillium psychrofluorescens]|uniref:uncharacterized protein n=1 Tax=Penicillium psychrofluorescens TaxID=3158075 RepID=UPI003CCDCC54
MAPLQEERTCWKCGATGHQNAQCPQLSRHVAPLPTQDEEKLGKRRSCLHQKAGQVQLPLQAGLFSPRQNTAAGQLLEASFMILLNTWKADGPPCRFCP